MKKFRFGSRVIALVLAMIMTISLFPLSALAAVGDIGTGTKQGDTGIDESTLGVKGSINWPVKIYDYLADGMLFEFAQFGGGTLSSDPSVSNVYGGGQYVLGEPMPYAAIGNDFTADVSYSESVWDGYSTENYRFVKTRVPAVNYVSPQYMRITSTGTYTTNFSTNMNCLITDFSNDQGGSIAKANARYIVLVYRAGGIENYGTVPGFAINIVNSAANWLRFPSNDGNLYDINGQTMTNTSEWRAFVCDLATLHPTNWAATTNINSLYLRLVQNSSSDYFDLSHVAYFSTPEAAVEYGDNCLQFMENPGEYISGGWNAANNTAYGMLYPTNGSMWPTGGGMGTSSYTNYWSQQIGYRQPDYDSNAATYNGNRYDGTDSDGRLNGTGNLIGDSNQIYFLNSSYATSDAYMAEHPDDYAEGFDTSELQYDGYTLLNKVTQGVMTTGLLEGVLGADGIPVYRQETVEYIADLLSKTLVIPQKGTNGSNNYNFVAGVKNREQYGSTAGAANDLAQGLRNCLGITFTNDAARGSTPQMGTYAQTVAKGDNLKGAFLTVANGGYITTCMDAAYYLLNNLFVPDSYNQTQDDFRYLTLSSATMDNGKEAYVFDGGFSYGADPEDLEDGTLTQDQYKELSQNAVNYSQSYHLNGDGTLSLGPVQSKDYFYYSASTTTTRFPFLPVVDSEGIYAGELDSYYFAEDGKRSFATEHGTYQNRNYCYVLASNGEFVYAEEDGLFFEFEGDDDVYLFLNGQLVLDLGAGHSVSNMSFEVNDYVYWAREVLENPGNYSDAEIARAAALNLEDGEVVSFDFYYMERHGYGANMRIVTNMRITDPDLQVEKTAYQGKEIEYGGIVDPDDPIEYNFRVTNTGNTKLYNLSLTDNHIGVSLTPENGLFVTGDDTPTEDDDINGFIVTDARNQRLEASDLQAVVTGYKNVGTGGDYILQNGEYVRVAEGTGTHTYYEGVYVTFADNEALKAFLRTLESSGTENETVDEEQTQAGAGLWVDASVVFKGIYYTMTDEQETEGVFNNTVYVTATTKSDTTEAGNETLRSEDSHRVYVTAIPSYYQWAENDLFISEQLVLNDATSEAGVTGSMLHDYLAFFNAVNKDTSKIYMSFADKYGNVLEQESAYQYVKAHTDADNVAGFKTNYDSPGIYEFYLLMYLKGATGDIETMNLGEYALVRVLIIVTDVEDSEYVLDYGLTSDNFDKDGELFKNDELYGSLSGTQVRLMGVSDTSPSYLNVLDGGSDYNRIDFSAVSLEENNKLQQEDGYYTVNLAIPSEGKQISYNEYSGRYSLTDEGTIVVHADVPYAWDEMYVYYWYDDNRNNGWPGDAMTMTSHGNFELAIPDNVPHIILSNGSHQTIDLHINPGMELWVDIDGSLNDSNKLNASIEYRSADGIVHASVPENWGDVYLYLWDEFGNPVSSWPGTQIETVDEDGYFTYTIPGDITNVIINNGDNGKQTLDLVVYAGQETWIEVNDTHDYTNEEQTVYYYNATSSRSTETVTFYATVPKDWAGASVYYWNGNGSNTGVAWPGIAMTDDGNGSYVLEGVPADVTNVIINSGEQANAKQTYDTVITPGLDTWFEVEPLAQSTTVQANVTTNWSSVYFYFFNNSVAGDEDSWPGTQAVDVFGNGTYVMRAPAYADHVIIHNGEGTQTADIALTPYKTNYFSVEANGAVTSTETTTLKIQSYENWTNSVYLHYWKDGGSGTSWPGVQLTMGDDGYYTYDIPAGCTHFIVHNNSGTQTADIPIPYLGGEIKVVFYQDGGHTCESTEILDTKSSANLSYGEQGAETGFNFTPTDFMDSVYDMYMAVTVYETDINVSQKPTELGEDINIGKEVQMFKKVSVLPATVVYYEDDFLGITYNYEGANVITHYGEGSGSLNQSINQSQEYGQDETYQGSHNDEMTGGSLTDVYINDTRAFATFDFTGTGFEIIGHTHAVGSGTLMVTIKQNGTTVKRVPVITEFDNGADGGTESIVSVPIVKVSDLAYGTYTVELSGVPIYDFSNWNGTGALPVETSYLCIDGVRIFQPLAGYEGTGEETDVRDYYTAPAPSYYQWDTSSELFIAEQQALIDATKASNINGHVLEAHKGFFDMVGNDIQKIYTSQCDANGATISNEDVVSFTDSAGNWGYKTSYDEIGVHTFYLFMRSLEKSDELRDAGLDQYDVSNYSDDEYAIIPISVIVVEDSAEEQASNLALSASYTAEEISNDSSTWHGNGCLNDGNTPSAVVYANGNWHGFLKNDNTNANGEAIITFDLGKRCSLEQFRMHLLYYRSWGINNPSYINVYTSDDDTNYRYVGDLSFTLLASDNTVTWASLTANAEGRYVKFVVGPANNNSTWVFVSECEIYGKLIRPNLGTSDTTYNVARDKEVIAVSHGRWGVCDLNDGVAQTGLQWTTDSDGNYTEWFGFHKLYNATEGYGEVLIDLENICDLSLFKVHLSKRWTDSGIGTAEKVTVEVSEDGVTYTEAETLTVNNSTTTDYWATLVTDTQGRYVRFKVYNDDNYAWVFLNEIEVYGEPARTPGVHDAYLETESGATFTEVRNLIADRRAFVIKYDDAEGLSVSGGTSTWIENRNNTLPSDRYSKWSNNIVNSVNDYLIAGPNNEVYMMEATEADKTALAFYVYEGNSNVRNIQIAVRAVDYGSFIGSNTTGLLHAEIQYGAYENEEYVWKTLTTTNSSSEQYFTIPYTECPYDAENERYQVVIRVADTDPTGMASYVSLKYKGVELLELNTTEVPDVIYDDELYNTIVDNNGNTLDSSKFVDFIELAGQMSSDTVVTPETPGGGAETPIVGADISAMGSLYDSFIPYNDRTFVLTENSRLYIVTDSEDTPPADDVLETAKLVQRQFAADGYDLEIVWGLEDFVEQGDIAALVDDEKYFVGMDGTEEAYQIHVSGWATTVLTRNSDGMLYGLNTIQKLFRYAGTNAIKGCEITDAPDTKERTVHLDVARKYLTKEFIKNMIAEMSWMGYNALELHFSEDVGFRADFWDPQYFTSPTNNDFSWLCGSQAQYWNLLANGSKPDVDEGRYLTAAELIEIFDTCEEYHIEVIPSFDSPGHVDWISRNYYANYQGATFNYEGTTYTLPSMLNVNNTVTNFTYSKLNIGNETIRKFSYALYTDIAAFFKEYAGSTKFNIGGDEIEAEAVTTWTYNDFINYMNDLNALLKEEGYTVRMYNDCVERTGTGYATSTSPKLDSDIEIVFWTDDKTSYKTASSWISDNRVMYNGINYWTYYALRIMDSTAYSSNANYGKDARDPSNTWWSFYRNQEDYSYAEWNPTRFNGYRASTSTTLNNSQLGGGYFMIWCDYMTLNTEVELWQGVWDSTDTSSNGQYFYSLIDRMWSNATKQWNWDINSTLTFANYETLRDTHGYFPGYDTVNTTKTTDYMSAPALPAEAEVSENAYRPTYTVTFKNYDGSVLSTQTVALGSSATAPANPTRPNDVWYDYTFTGWDTTFNNITGDTVVTAQYSSTAATPGTRGYLEITVSGGTNFNMSIDGAAARAMGVDYLNAGMALGKSVTVAAETTNGNRFVGWINAKTGDIISTARTYTFYTSGNDVLIALFDTDIENKGTVTFKIDKTNQILDIQYYSSTDSIVFPADPTFPGYAFAGWDHTQAEIQAKLQAGRDVIVYATWVLEDAYFSITVEGGTVTTSGGVVNGKYTAYKGTVISANTAPSGKIFSHWEDSEGNIVSYDSEYKFYPYRDETFTAVFVPRYIHDIDIIGTYVEESQPEVEETPDENATTFRVYFTNNWLWSDVCIHYWNNNDRSDIMTNTTWPGVGMYFDDYYIINGIEYEVWYYDVPVGITGMLIDGLKNEDPTQRDQTPDITEFVDQRGYSMTWNDGNQVVIDDSRVPNAPAQTTTLYVTTPDSNGVYAAYVWNGNSETEWLSLTQVTGNTYSVAVPTKYTNVIFAKLSQGSTADWSNVATQSVDLTITGNNNYFVIGDTFIGGKYTGSWTNMVNVYFSNANDWDDIRVDYTANVNGTVVSGTVYADMTSGTDGLYAVLVPADITSITFTDSDTSEGTGYTYTVVPGDVIENAIFGLTNVDRDLDYDVITNVFMDATSLRDSNTIFFSWSVPEELGYTFVNAGVLLVEDTYYNANTFVTGTIDEKVIQFVPARKYLTDTGAHSLTIPNVANGDTWIFQSFVQYKDENGALRTKYSNKYTVTKTVS